MPRGDGTGPMGGGAMTGRGMGFCGGYRTGGFANYGRGFFGAGRGGRGMGCRNYYRWANNVPQEYAPISPEEEKKYVAEDIKELELELQKLKKHMADLEAASKKKE
jgi:hypothetical protein